MMKDIVFAPEQIGNADDAYAMLANRFHIRKGNHIRIVRRFIDARHKDRIKIVYRVEEETRESEAEISKRDEELAFPYRNAHPRLMERPVIVGFGPAGMYAGLVLAEYGLRPLIIERGSDVDKRAVDIDNVRNGGAVDPESNVQFGEGGAGTFSDGKLFSGVSDGRRDPVLRTFVKYGAPKTILFDAHPHIGTDYLRVVIRNMRQDLIKRGAQVMLLYNDPDRRWVNGTLAKVVDFGEEFVRVETERLAPFSYLANSFSSTLKLTFRCSISTI